jgi:HSP20 family protein
VTKNLLSDGALYITMNSESPGPSDVERKVGKAVVEAARMSGQASRAAKRILSEMAGDMAEAKGYDLPAVDLIETNEEIIVRVALPGASKEKIDLRVTEESISVDAKATPAEGKYLRRETSPLGFKRDLKLPVEIKPEQVKATYENGILEVRLPKLVVINPTTVKVE